MASNFELFLSKELSKIPPSLIGCLKPLLKCRFGAQSKKYRPKGKASKIQESFDVPAYVLHHIMMGQNWPEGTLYPTFLHFSEKWKAFRNAFRLSRKSQSFIHKIVDFLNQMIKGNY